MTDQELIKRPFDEEFDTMMEVQRNPTGAWMAIQEQANRIERTEAKLTRAMGFLKTMAVYNKYVIAPFLAELEGKDHV